MSGPRGLLPALLIAVILAGAAAGALVWSGAYDVGADAAHTRPVHALLQTIRERSIAARAQDLQVPDLSDPARIRQGAGNYHAMCMGCHLAPGMPESELSRGLYPAPPDFSSTPVDPAVAFWVTKHGIKGSGMPAWGRSMGDEYIWNLVAFLQQLPDLDADGYAALVASSGGHDHGGGETIEQVHAAPVHAPHADADSAHGSAAGAHPPPKPTTPAMTEHRHADGTVESHPVDVPAPAGGDDGHDHQH